VISYKVSGAITYFSDHNELYWDAVGTEWPVRIARAQVNIDLSDFPDYVIDPEAVICFSGPPGSTSQNCEISIISDDRVTISAENALNPGEGLTVAVTLPKEGIAHLEPVEYKDYT